MESVIKAAAMGERLSGKIGDLGPLFEYSDQAGLLTWFLELVLYRLVSRLGMHFSKMAVAHPWITPTFTALTEVGRGSSTSWRFSCFSGLI